MLQEQTAHESVENSLTPRFKTDTLIALARITASLIAQDQTLPNVQAKAESNLLSQFARTLEKENYVMLGIEKTGRLGGAFRALFRGSERMLGHAQKMKAQNATVGLLFANKQAKILCQMQAHIEKQNKRVRVPWKTISGLMLVS